MSDRFDEIKKRYEAATEGPWACRPSLDANDELCEDIISKACGNLTIASEMKGVDADFAAHARKDVPFMLTLINILAQELVIEAAERCHVKTVNEVLVNFSARVEDTQ